MNPTHILTNFQKYILQQENFNDIAELVKLGSLH
jgi:hypothetical protein